jgi:hypothetical protein
MSMSDDPTLPDAFGHMIEREFNECLDEWAMSVEENGPRHETTIIWRARTDEALRIGVFLGVLSYHDQGDRIRAIDPLIDPLKAINELERGPES